MRGTVTFFKVDKGWGAIASPELPDGQDAFVHFSRIEATGYRSLAAGDLVEFDAVPAVQDSFRWLADHVVRTGSGPAPVLRREGGRLIADMPADAPPAAR